MALPWALSLTTIARMLVGVGLIYFVWPAAAFRLDDVAVKDRRCAQLGLMLTWLIVGGYAAAAVGAFGIGFLLLWAFAARFLFFRVRSTNRYRLSPIAASLAATLDNLAVIGELPARARSFLARTAGTLASAVRGLGSQAPRLVVLALVIGLAAYIRFAWNLEHAALLFSDAYETVAWAKGLALGQVFPNGVYPQGMYVTIASVRSLTQASPVVLEKFFGPFVGVCMVLSVMWTTYRMSGGSLVAVLAAGALYGALPALLPYAAPRQAATDSQEFGDALVLPLMWLVFQSWVTRQRGYRLGAVGLLTAIALTHPIALINAVLAAVAATLAGWLVAGVGTRALGEYVALVLAGATLAVAPLAIGLALHVPFLATAVPFATAGGPLAAPAITTLSLVAGAGTLGLFVVRLGWRLSDWELGVPVAAFLVWALAMFVQQLPRLGISNLALAVRSGELVALSEGLGIGMGFLALDLLRQRYLPGGKGVRALPLVLWGAGFLILLVRHPPTPLASYTMDSDAYVAEFERIATTLPRYDWLSVAYDGYPLALGQGFNEGPAAWAKNASVATAWPRYRLNGRARPISEAYVFFFVERWGPGPALSGYRHFDAVYAAARRTTMAWIDRWQARHGPMPVFFRNRDLTVYYLRAPGAPPPT